MSDNDHVQIVITQDSVGVVGPGTDIPLILSANASWAERVRFYTSLAGAAVDFPTTSGPEYVAIARMFAQNPKPAQIAVGRCALPPTQKYVVGVAAAAVATEYKLQVEGEGVTATAITVTSGSAQAFTGANTGDLCTAVAHGHSTGDGPFRLTGGALPTGYAIDTDYWIIRISADTFQLAASRTLALATTAIVITVDGSGTLNGATNDVIIARIVQALNDVVGKNYTAVQTVGSGETDVATVTATAAGDWFSIAVLDMAKLSTEQTHVDPGLATDLAAIALEDSSWYGIAGYPYASNACVKAIAGWAESAEKLYFADTADTEVATVALAGADDTGEDLYDLGYERTAPCFHLSPADMFAAGFMARFLATKPGSATGKFKTITGVNPMALTATHKTNLRAKRVNAYERVWGVPITWEGVCSDVSTYIDMTRNDDWVKGTMATRIFGTLAANDIVPFTDPGIAVICNDVRSTLEDAVKAGIYASYAIEVPKAADVADDNKLNRLLPDIRFSAVRAGAIHGVKPVNGVISL